MAYDLSFYKGKRILVTGHTGFKGTWLCKTLLLAGAQVVGYALEPEQEPNLFELSGIREQMQSVYGDIRDYESLNKVFEMVQPEIVFHLAAQPIVRESYKNPVYTYDTNVMGTVNVLECIRMSRTVKSFLNITTDKVYLNHEWERGYMEEDELNGYDPYSNSKSCSELVTSSYANSFLKAAGVAVSTARAGNVLGGGDFSIDRIIPDCVRAAIKQEKIVVRNAESVRPYQHVLEAVVVYLMIAEAQYKDVSLAGSYNVGPDDNDCIKTGELVELFCSLWNKCRKTAISWMSKCDSGPHEATYLKLDCKKLKTTFRWAPQWDVGKTMEKVVEWFDAYYSGRSIVACMEEQIKEFIEHNHKPISVIMLTYNREEYVGRAIESVLAQTMKNFEFIIVDNGATDRSGEIADSYAEKDDRIRVVHIPKNINIGTGRNAGLDAATGTYITFIDDDDIAEPDMLEFLYDLAMEENADIAICGSTKEVNGEILPNYVFDEKLVMTAEEAVVEMLRRKKYNAAEPTKLMRRSLFDKIRFCPDRVIDDISVMYKYFAETHCVVAHGKPKYCFWRHPGNISAFTTNDKLWTAERLDEYFLAFRERTEYLSQKLPKIADYVQYSEWSYMISMCNKIVSNNLENCEKQLVYVKKELTEHYDEFYDSPYIEEFEKEFMRKYIGGK